MNKLKLFIKIPFKNKKMLFEAYFFLAFARILKYRKFSQVSSKLGERMAETNEKLDQDHFKISKQISQVIDIACKYTFWESECLVKAYTAIHMLKRRGINYTLYLGTAKDKNGKLIAHAWVRSGPIFITGYNGKEKFTVVATFASSFHKEHSRCKFIN